MANPKLFLSYSWSSPDHESWVLQFAEELVSQGIGVIFDKWDLKPGHDANAFMESMVSDSEVTKVILVCDEKYAEKSDKRSGGAGTEAQIVTAELYAKKAQDKFVAVVRERDADGKAYLPVYYGILTHVAPAMGWR
jgi:SEFIR domain